MDKVIIAVGAAILGMLLVVGIVILGSLMGALTGWIVGLMFEETILGIFGQIGVKGVAMWQLGVFFGFVGGFFKSVSTTSK